jgi:hypothetical protein
MVPTINYGERYIEANPHFNVRCTRLLPMRCLSTEMVSCSEVSVWNATDRTAIGLLVALKKHIVAYNINVSVCAEHWLEHELALVAYV